VAGGVEGHQPERSLLGGCGQFFMLQAQVAVVAAEVDAEGVEVLLGGGTYLVGAASVERATHRVTAMDVAAQGAE